MRYGSRPFEVIFDDITSEGAQSRAHIAACLTTSCTSGTRQPCLVAAMPPQSWTPRWLSPSLTAPTCHLGRTQSELQTPAVGTRSQRFRVVGVRENVVVGARSCNDKEQSNATYYGPSEDGPTDPKWATDHAERMADAMLEVKVNERLALADRSTDSNVVQLDEILIIEGITVWLEDAGVLNPPAARPVSMYAMASPAMDTGLILREDIRCLRAW